MIDVLDSKIDIMTTVTSYSIDCLIWTTREPFQTHTFMQNCKVDKVSDGWKASTAICANDATRGHGNIQGILDVEQALSLALISRQFCAFLFHL